MEKYKKGGGEKLQLYDPKNGEYTDEDKKKLFEDEMSNIVLRCIFNDDDTYIPRYPIFGFHDDDYCRLYVGYCIKKPHFFINKKKVTDYLLTFRKNSDKSLFFKKQGYTLENSNELYNQLIEGSNIDTIKYNKIHPYGLNVEMTTTIQSITYNKKIAMKSIWRFEEDNNRLMFITVILKKQGE